MEVPEELAEPLEKIGVPVAVTVPALQDALAVQQGQQSETKGQPKAGEDKQKAGQDKQQVKQLPKTGGPELGAVLLPVAALLAVSGLVGYAVVRRR